MLLKAARGQAFSIDFLIALFILFGLLGTFNTLWFHLMQEQSVDKTLKAQRVLAELVERPAYPKNATAGQWKSVGIANTWRVLEENQVAAWMNLTRYDVSSAANLLDQDISAVSFKLTYANGSIVQVNDSAYSGNVSWQFGTLGPSIAVAHAWAILNGQAVRAELKLS